MIAQAAQLLQALAYQATAILAMVASGHACPLPAPHPAQMTLYLYTYYTAAEGNGDGLLPWPDLDRPGELLVANEWTGRVAACTVWRYGDRINSRLLDRDLLCYDNFGVPPWRTLSCSHWGEWAHRVDVLLPEGTDPPWWSGGYWR